MLSPEYPRYHWWLLLETPTHLLQRARQHRDVTKRPSNRQHGTSTHTTRLCVNTTALLLTRAHNNIPRCFRACLCGLDELDWFERGRTSAQARITYILCIQVCFCFNNSLSTWGMATGGGADERSVALRSAQSSHTHSSDTVVSVRRPALVTALSSPFLGF